MFCPRVALRMCCQTVCKRPFCTAAARPRHNRERPRAQLEGPSGIVGASYGLSQWGSQRVPLCLRAPSTAPRAMGHESRAIWHWVQSAILVGHKGRARVRNNRSH